MDQLPSYKSIIVIVIVIVLIILQTVVRGAGSDSECLWTNSFSGPAVSSSKMRPARSNFPSAPVVATVELF